MNKQFGAIERKINIIFQRTISNKNFYFYLTPAGKMKYKQLLNNFWGRFSSQLFIKKTKCTACNNDLIINKNTTI